MKRDQLLGGKDYPQDVEWVMYWEGRVFQKAELSDWQKRICEEVCKVLAAACLAACL